jgi:hypothetical protein
MPNFTSICTYIKYILYNTYNFKLWFSALWVGVVWLLDISASVEYANSAFTVAMKTLCLINAYLNGLVLDMLYIYIYSTNHLYK